METDQMNVKFTPNSFAKRFFGLKLDDYTGTEGVTDLLEQVLGKEDYDKYVISQDPFCGGVTKSSIRIILNRDEFDPKVASSIYSVEFATIGTIEQIQK